MGRRRRNGQGTKPSINFNEEVESGVPPRLHPPTPIAWQPKISPMSLLSTAAEQNINSANTPNADLNEFYVKIRQCSLTIISCVEAIQNGMSSNSHDALQVNNQNDNDQTEIYNDKVAHETEQNENLDAVRNSTIEISRMQMFNSASVLGEYTLTSPIVTDAVGEDQQQLGDTTSQNAKINAHLVEEHTNCEPSSNLQLAIQEFVDTEKSYLHKLRQLNKEFVVRLTAYHELDGVASILTPDQIELIFSNLEGIVRLHTHIYLDIKTLRNRPRLDHPFLDILDRLADKLVDTYTGYAINFACHQNIISDLMSKNSKFADFVAVSERCCTGKNVKLASLRMEPIQRISRYILLVESIRKNADPITDPIPQLDAIMLKFRDAAEHIDANMKVAQAKQRVIEIQEIFLENTPDPSLVVPGRYCIRESALQMLSHKKGWTGAMKHIHKNFCFILFNDCLVYCTIISENPRRGRMKGFLDLLNITVDETIVDGNDTSFVITTLSDASTSSLFILAKTTQQKKEWIDDLQICIRQRKELHRQHDSFQVDSDFSTEHKHPASFSELQMTAALQLEPVLSPSGTEQLPSQIELAKKLTRKASTRHSIQ